MSGIALVAYAAGTVVVKEMLQDAAINVTKVDSMAASTILFLSQSTYVLRMKKHSEKMADAISRPVAILSNTRHLPGFSFGVKLRYRFVARRIKGRYRVTIYKPFTLLHCERSKYVHSS
jgi:hypothetical protein